ncbi:MAG TPA: hypothetical protein VF581_11880 [Flavobacterium sp.]|jgi:hypothetical protein
MDILRILLATLVATSLMTMFSYYLSEKFNALYKEPVLLKKIMEMTKLHFNSSVQTVLGWLIHYLVGLLFVIAYDRLWHTGYVDATWFSGILLGIASGIIGVVGWMFLFSIPNHAPRVKYREYYQQLFFAHIIFALAAVTIYKLWPLD